MWLALSGTLILPMDAAHLRSYAAKGKKTDGVRLGMIVAHLRAGVGGISKGWHSHVKTSLH